MKVNVRCSLVSVCQSMVFAILTEMRFLCTDTCIIIYRLICSKQFVERCLCKKVRTIYKVKVYSMKTINCFVIATALVITLGSASLYAMDHEKEAQEAAVDQANIQLCAAIRSNQMKRIHTALRSGAQVNKPDANGWTPLYWAAYKGKAEIVRILVAAHADVNQVNADGYISLCWTACNGNAEIASILIAAGADVNKVDRNASAPLLLASQNGHTEIALMLLEASADPNQADNILFMAAANRHSKMAKILAFHGSRMPFNYSNAVSESMKAVILQAKEARRAIGNQDWLLEDVPLSLFLPDVLKALVGEYIDPLAGVHDEQLRRCMRQQVVKNRIERRKQEGSVVAQLLERA